MRAVVQRARSARVDVGEECVGSIGPGLCVLVGVTHDDDEDEALKLARKLHGLRVFDDEAGVMNRSIDDVGGAILIVSQFTLYGDASKGRRPSWTRAARPEHAEPLIETVVDELRTLGVDVETGRFRADMVVTLENDGPVTIILEI
ncbi:MAG: D-aminoacyl-tRNA deacylase [Actinomycetota bacterium]